MNRVTVYPWLPNHPLGWVIYGKHAGRGPRYGTPLVTYPSPRKLARLAQQAALEWSIA